MKKFIFLFFVLLGAKNVYAQSAGESVDRLLTFEQREVSHNKRLISKFIKLYATVLTKESYLKNANFIVRTKKDEIFFMLRYNKENILIIDEDNKKAFVLPRNGQQPFIYFDQQHKGKSKIRRISRKVRKGKYQVSLIKF